ncbi:beta-lactamase hydrolase domain-containing protein [Rhodopirellula sallentina]|uniref:Beta-lactamase hydrolase-like protein n=1 Tax=Rhodopirellula sallentina SM41 TaxID=1263870 RepID=M5U8H6_9BACT|nr:protein tyrosine phosphatase family protein [Rhodopirellula sallentina]EMI57730.1 Beta-lactamase hydrolase-like protein [Rhodopirellula sallentina SM41]
MSNRMKFSDAATVGPQPREAELKSLAADNYQAVINLRTEGEDDQPMSPAEEADVVRAHGMEYLHHPVSMDAIDESLVDAFRRQYVALPKPVFVHCKSGKRAGAMMMMHTAAENGMSGEEALEKAKEMGFECDQPELEKFVKQYVNNRSQAKTT